VNAERDKENEEIEQSENRIPRMSEWSSIIDEVIGEAIDEGSFDNLPGQGKPLKLSSNPYGQDSELAFELLKHNEYTLPWIAERSALLKEIEELREVIGRVWTEYSQEYQVAQSEMIRSGLKMDWAKQLEDWQGEIRDLNKRIARTNLKQPGEKLEILKLTIDTELRRAGARSELN
jgi:DnaJ family protein C protein 28